MRGALTYLPDDTGAVRFAFYDSGNFINSISGAKKEIPAGVKKGKEVTRWVWKCQKDQLLKTIQKLATGKWDSSFETDDIGLGALGPDIDGRPVTKLKKIMAFVKGVRNAFDDACKNISFEDSTVNMYQAPQKSGNCDVESMAAALHDILHGAVYRLYRIGNFVKAFLHFHRLYTDAAYADAAADDVCVAGRPLSDLSAFDKTLLAGATDAGVGSGGEASPASSFQQRLGGDPLPHPGAGGSTHNRITTSGVAQPDLAHDEWSSTTPSSWITTKGVAQPDLARRVLNEYMKTRVVRNWAQGDVGQTSPSSSALMVCSVLPGRKGMMVLQGVGFTPSVLIQPGDPKEPTPCGKELVQ